LTGKRTDALVAVGLLGSNYTFSCYATGLAYIAFFGASYLLLPVLLAPLLRLRRLAPAAGHRCS
jgi:hypothetical protein